MHGYCTYMIPCYSTLLCTLSEETHDKAKESIAYTWACFQMQIHYNEERSKQINLHLVLHSAATTHTHIASDNLDITWAQQIYL